MATTSFAAGAYSATQNLSAARAARPASGPGETAGAGRGDFGALLQGAMDGLAETGRKADAGAMGVATGSANLVDVVTAVAESETALQTLVAVRDRMISSYEEMMRMQI